MPVLPNGASRAVLAGQNYYRIKREIQSPGDVFEIDVSAAAMYIGPDSDIAEARVTYYDPQAPNELQTFDVGLGGPLVERVISSPGDVVSSTGMPATTLVSPADVVNNAYERPAVSPFVPQRRINFPAEIDFIASLSPPPSIPITRADKTFRIPNVPFEDSGVVPSDGSTDLVVPIYGRRFVSVQAVVPVGVGVTFSYFLAALQPGQNTAPNGVGSISRSAISIQTVEAAVLLASRDYTNLVDSGGNITFFPTTAQGPKGLADLLIINVADNGSPPGTHEIDFFIKVSDREVG